MGDAPAATRGQMSWNRRDYRTYIMTSLTSFANGTGYRVRGFARSVRNLSSFGESSSAYFSAPVDGSISSTSGAQHSGSGESSACGSPKLSANSSRKSSSCLTGYALTV